MKKLLAVITLMVMVAGSLPFMSNAQEITYKVQKAFENKFPEAKSVSWTEYDDYYSVSFELNDIRMNSVFNKDGEFIGSSHTIAKENLPLALQMRINERYPGYQYSGQITEINYSSSTSYIIYIENDKERIKLKSTGGEDLSVEKKFKISQSR